MNKGNTFDVIVVGSGIAGLVTALATPKSKRVLIVTKGEIKDSNTDLAQGGIAAVIDPKDKIREHVKDTLAAGQQHNKKSSVSQILNMAPDAIQYLSELGVPFNRNKDGSYELSLEGGHSHKRVVHVRDTTGHVIESTLAGWVRKARNITILERTPAKDLLVHRGTCYGVEVWPSVKALKSQKSAAQKSEQYFAGKIVLASGGAGQVYKKTTNPPVTTGDGIAMAIRAGARVKDMEFVQFHPTALNDNTSPLFLLSETLRGEGARLRNAQKKYFMTSHPLKDLAPRDIVSQAIFRELKKGPVYLDLTIIPPHILRKKYPAIVGELLKRGYKPFAKPIPVTPAAHYLCGGVVTGMKGQTSIKHLYAAGEVACTGLHGANRLASNSLLEGVVMGRIIASHPVKKIQSPRRIFQRSQYKKQKLPPELKGTIQSLMWEGAGIERNKQGLQKTLNGLRSLKKKVPSPTDGPTTEIQNLLTVSISIVQSALRRKKSLGTHARNDQ